MQNHGKIKLFHLQLQLLCFEQPYVQKFLLEADWAETHGSAVTVAVSDTCLQPLLYLDP